jgi:hypothetical protein
MPVDLENSGDPRSRLVRQKYFCIRPQPLERWLWSQRIPSSAERVFWLHWQEGMQRGDWCSEIPLRRVARDCHLDTSTVTRAYQLLIRLGCLRRTDPGRDPANPFQQATAVTEIRLPRELLQDLNRYPNRRCTSESRGASDGQGRAHGIPTKDSRDASPAMTPPFPGSNTAQGNSTTPAPEDSPATAPSEPEPFPQHRPDDCPEPTAQGASRPLKSSDPFPSLTGRDRLRAISQLLDPLSPQERRTYQDALRMHHTTMEFDPHSGVSADTQNRILQLLASLAVPTSPSLRPSTLSPTPSSSPHPHKSPAPRKLSLFELGRLRHHLQTATSTAAAPDLLRQVVWSVEAGSLRRFDTRHAVHIALKKIREGHWTRPNRMPPNWARTLSEPPVAETCGIA